MPAQVLTFQVSILSNTDDWEVRLSEVESARDVLRALAERQGFRLVATEGVKLEQGYGKLFSSSGRSELDVKSALLLVVTAPRCFRKCASTSISRPAHSAAPPKSR